MRRVTARLHHVSVQVPLEDLPACRAFYEDLLLLEPIPNLAGIQWYRLAEGCHLHLLAGPPAPIESIAHFALHVEDLRGTLDRCRGAGFEPSEADRIWGEERWFVRDPVGNLIELFAVAPVDPPPQR
jgi:catechol 2,3-dioxygenase-like lactoylglutathione lyase family enzyme